MKKNKKIKSINTLFLLRLSKGYTIVEIIIVIVVIGILAAISFVSYNGLQARARDASVLSDIDNMDGLQTNYGLKNNVAGKAYYSSAGTDSALGFTPTSGNVIDVSINSNDYCVRAYNPKGAKNSIWNSYTKESTVGVCSTISPSMAAITDSLPPTATTLNPVADWLAYPQGDHYGSLYDLVGKQWATVSRLNAKTVYDSAAQRIYDVPANKLAVNYRNDGKSGYEAVIEGPRTNYVLQSSFENTMSGWNHQYVANGSSAPSTDRSVYGSYSLKITRTLAASEANVYQSLSGLAASTVYTYSAWSWASTANTACIYTYIGDSNTPNTCNSGASKWERLSGKFTSTAAGTIQLRLVHTNGSTNLNSVYFDAVQVEQSAPATTYIPTTTAIASRNADVVTVPTTGWNASNGSVLILSKQESSNDSSCPGYYYRSLLDIQASGNNFFIRPNCWGGVENYYGLNGDGVATYAFNPTANTSWVNAMTWSLNNLKAYLNGTLKVTDSSASLLSNLPNSIIYVGSHGGGTPLNGSIMRIVVYGSQLSDSDITTVSNNIKNGL